MQYSKEIKPHANSKYFLRNEQDFHLQFFILCLQIIENLIRKLEQIHIIIGQ